MAVLGLSLSLLVQSAGAPLASLARVPNVSVSITTLPDNATSTTNSYATTGAYVAYDVTITTNSSNSSRACPRRSSSRRSRSCRR